MHKIIIASRRDFNNYNLLKENLDNLLQDKVNVEIVSGCARGADTLAIQYAEEKGYPVKR